MGLEPFKDFWFFFFSSLFIEANALEDQNTNAVC